MWKATVASEYTPFQLSLQGARQLFNHMSTLLATTMAKSLHKRLYQVLLQQVATDLLPIRPDRSEPRVVKRRPKPFARMQQPRPVLKAKLAA